MCSAQIFEELSVLLSIQGQMEVGSVEILRERCQ